MSIKIVERDDAGRMHAISLRRNEVTSTPVRGGRGEPNGVHLLGFLARVFLPAGWPESVSPDYLHYQIWNALQAFCSSLAGMISSRAILEGFGVGNASASATHALLLTVTQDICSRLTTILAAYYVGPSLFPEAKAYRLSADIFNDGAITLDALSPLLNAAALPFALPVPVPASAPGLRVAALCLSGALRALCGIAAGGSKAALTMHFATPVRGKGDLGDLNAKDASKETVLSLSGMLLGTLVVPYLVTPWATYTALFLLLTCHLAANYVAVRGVALRTLNRQRAGIAWTTYRHSGDAHVPSPAQVSKKERVFEWPGALRDAHTGRNMGRCAVGSSARRILRRPVPSRVLGLFARERYVLWFDPRSLCARPGRPGQSVRGRLRLHVCVKEGCAALDQLKAWAHALEVGRVWVLRQAVEGEGDEDEDEASAIVRVAHERVEARFAGFVGRMRGAGWDVDGGQLLAGSPAAVLLSVEEDGVGLSGDVRCEEKKRV